MEEQRKKKTQAQAASRAAISRQNKKETEKKKSTKATRRRKEFRLQGLSLFSPHSSLFSPHSSLFSPHSSAPPATLHAHTRVREVVGCNWMNDVTCRYLSLTHPQRLGAGTFPHPPAASSPRHRSTQTNRPTPAPMRPEVARRRGRRVGWVGGRGGEREGGGKKATLLVVTYRNLSLPHQWDELFSSKSEAVSSLLVVTYRCLSLRIVTHRYLSLPRRWDQRRAHPRARRCPPTVAPSQNLDSKSRAQEAPLSASIYPVTVANGPARAAA